MISEAAALMESLRSEERVRFLNGETKHRRGGYTFVSTGPTHGNGRTVRFLFPLIFCPISEDNVETRKSKGTPSGDRRTIED